MEDRKVMDRTTGPPDVLALHPRPLNWSAIRVDRAGREETFISRAWTKEDAEACRLCSTCTARVGRLGRTALCSHRVSGLVPDEEVPMFRFRPTEDGRQAASGGSVA